MQRTAFKSWMLDNGLNRNAAARALGVTVNTIIAYETAADLKPMVRLAMAAIAANLPAHGK